ncbi:MAG: hypothetical protein J6Y72_00400 [Bacteroidales bacterium]|nr:hypothetical protein [Bacteroidales bacterium]
MKMVWAYVVILSVAKDLSRWAWAVPTPELKARLLPCTYISLAQITLITLIDSIWWSWFISYS